MELEDYNDERLEAELALRARRREQGQCDYCARPWTTKPCKYPDRHAKPGDLFYLRWKIRYSESWINAESPTGTHAINLSQHGGGAALFHREAPGGPSFTERIAHRPMPAAEYDRRDNRQRIVAAIDWAEGVIREQAT